MGAFAQYLSEEFEVTVITEAVEGYNMVSDDFKVIPIKKKLGRNKFDFYQPTGWLKHKAKAAYNQLFYRLFEDENQGWTQSAIKELEQLQQNHPIDILLSSYAPVSPLIAGLKFKGNHPSVKWAVDFRDEMSLSPNWPTARKAYLRQLEEQVLSKADMVVSVAEPIVSSFKTLCKRSIPCIEVRNGFNRPVNETTFESNKWVIKHVGTFFGERQPTLFFQALEALVKAGDIPLNDLDIQFVGQQQSYTVPAFFSSVFTAVDRIPQAAALQHMDQSNLLLLILPKSDRKGMFSGKVFDYLSSNHPILALVDKEDVAADLIRQAKAGYIVDHDDLTEIKQVLRNAYSDWKSKEPFTPDLTIIKAQHRKEQVGYFSQQLRQLLET